MTKCSAVFVSNDNAGGGDGDDEDDDDDAVDDQKVVWSAKCGARFPW